MSSEGPHKGFRFKYLLPKSCRQKVGRAHFQIWHILLSSLQVKRHQIRKKKLLVKFHKHWHICDYEAGPDWETCSDLEERDWILKQLASESSSILCVLCQSSSPLSSCVWITFNVFSGEEMWSLHHSAICPYFSLSSIYFTSSKKPSNKKWLSISGLIRSSCRQRQGMRSLA